jgi:hypothetical protein
VFVREKHPDRYDDDEWPLSARASIEQNEFARISSNDNHKTDLIDKPSFMIVDGFFFSFKYSLCLLSEEQDINVLNKNSTQYEQISQTNGSTTRSISVSQH